MAVSLGILPPWLQRYTLFSRKKKFAHAGLEGSCSAPTFDPARLGSLGEHR